MAFGFTKSRISPIAIDFGADSLKLLQVSGSDPAQLVAAASVVIPEDARQDNAARLLFFEESLRALLRDLPFKGRRVICAIPSHQTFVHQVECVVSEGVAVQGQVDQHLAERLGINPARMVMRYAHVGAVLRHGQTRQSVVCIGAAKEVVMKYVELAHRHRLEVVGMHSEAPCVVRAFEVLGEAGRLDPGPVTCFVDIGATTTKVVIAQGAKLFFAKTIQTGGDYLVRAHARRHAMSFEEARFSRIAASELQGGGAAVAAAEPAGGDAEAQAAEMIQEELKLCLRYHASMGQSDPVERLIFFGGEATHRQICLAIARAMQLPAQIGDPMACVTRVAAANLVRGVDLSRTLPGWVVPFGLCYSDANL